MTLKFFLVRYIKMDTNIDHITMLAHACVVANYCASDRVKGLVQQTNFSFLLLPISCFDDAMIEL